MIGVATAELYPHLSIDGSIAVDANNFSDLFKPGSLQGQVGPSLQWNFLNYGRLVNGIRVQDAKFQELAYQYQTVVLLANEEVENAGTSFLKAQQRLRRLILSVNSAREAVASVVVEYEERKTSFNNVFTCQQFLATVEDQMTLAQADAASNLIRLYTALGGGWKTPPDRVSSVPVEEAAPVPGRMPAPPAAVAPLPPAVIAAPGAAK